MRVLAQATHVPRPEHRDDLLDAMRRMNAAADGLDGLDAIGAFEDVETGRLVAISLWQSADAMQVGLQALGAVVASVPFSEWESEPPTFVVLPEVAVEARL